MAPAEHTPKPTYKVGEYALCFHHELLYEAKILDVELNEDDEKDAGYLYRVHYKGWKNTWDDWVPEERLRRDNEENRQLQKDIAQQQKRPKATKKANADNSNRASEDRHSSAPTAGRGTKRGRDYDIEKVGNCISFGLHEFASGPRPRGIWEPEKVDVAKQPISWKSAGGESFASSKDWFTAEKVRTGPAPNLANGSSEERPSKEDLEIWTLLSKTKAPPKPELYSVTKHSWKRGNNVKISMKGIRLERIQLPEEPLPTKRNKESKPSIMSPIMSPATTTMAPPTSMGQLISMIQPSVEKEATATEALADTISDKAITESTASRHYGAGPETSSLPASKGITRSQRTRSLHSSTQDSAPPSEKRYVPTARSYVDANESKKDGEVTTMARPKRKQMASATSAPKNTKRQPKSRFLPTGATVKADGTVVHIPECILEREARNVGANGKPKLNPAKSVLNRPVHRQDLRVNTCMSIEQSTPISMLESAHKTIPSAPKTGTSSASSLTTPPESPRSHRSASAKSFKPSAAAASNEDLANRSAASRAPTNAVSASPAGEYTHPAPNPKVNEAPQTLARSTSQAPLPTPRTSPGPVPDTHSSSPGTLDTATIPTSSATSMSLASPEISQNSSISSKATITAESVDIPSPAAPAAIWRAGRGRKPAERALEFQDLIASEASDKKGEETFIHRPTIRISVPDTIKALLVDDWENVTKNLTLAPLPHPHPVSELLRSYLAEEQSRRKSSSIEYDRVEEVTAGVKEYFDKCLGVMLLYKFERQQYKDILAKTIDSGDVQWEGKTISDVYGAEHLCRLFVSFPELIAQTNMDQQSVSALREELAKLTSWLAKNAEDWFALDKYVGPSKEYTEKARAL